MTRTSLARLAGPERCWLAEGIIWDDRTAEAVWVDIHNGDLLRNLDEPVRTHLDETVGAVALAADGGLLVAGHRGLIAIAADGAVSHGPSLVGEASRLNDGIVDPQGRFIVGSAAIGETSHDERLLRISPDGTVETLRSGLSLSNGLGILGDGTLLHIDTWVKTVSALVDGAWVTMLDDFEHYPDGLTVDSEDCIWIAMYGGGCVNRYSRSGELLEVVTIGTVEATCPGFIGPDLTTLAITSGRESATDELAGAIFLAEVDAQGTTENRWAGSTSHPYWLT